jgi:hypothetical protein
MPRFLCGTVSSGAALVEPVKGCGMIQQVWAGRFTDDRQVWLSMLIAAMQDAARPEVRALPCTHSTLAGLRAQLARPVPRHPPGATPFSLYN